MRRSFSCSVCVTLLREAPVYFKEFCGVFNAVGRAYLNSVLQNCFLPYCWDVWGSFLRNCVCRVQQGFEVQLKIPVCRYESFAEPVRRFPGGDSIFVLHPSSACLLPNRPFLTKTRDSDASRASCEAQWRVPLGRKDPPPYSLNIE